MEALPWLIPKVGKITRSSQVRKMDSHNLSVLKVKLISTMAIESTVGDVAGA